MLYSSCKGPLLDVAEQNIGMDIPRKVSAVDSAEGVENNGHFIAVLLLRLVVIQFLTL